MCLWPLTFPSEALVRDLLGLPAAMLTSRLKKVIGCRRSVVGGLGSAFLQCTALSQGPGCWDTEELLGSPRHCVPNTNALSYFLPFPALLKYNCQIKSAYI
jgi:hypothetical protein